MDAYRRVLSIPGTAAVLLLGLLARIPFSTLGLLLTLHTVLTLERSYFEAAGRPLKVVSRHGLVRNPCL